jgi:cytochrome c556
MRREKQMVRIVLAGAVVVLGVSAVVAQSNPIEERNALMKSMWREGLAPSFRMVRGQEPYDSAKVGAGFAKMSEVAGKVPPLWPANSRPTNPTTDYYSSAKIWENKSDFEAKLTNFAKIVADNRAKATTNLDGLKAAFPAVNKGCDDCHESYRVKRN